MTSGHAKSNTSVPRDDTWQALVELALYGKPDHEGPSVDQVVEAIRGLNLPLDCLEQLRQIVTGAIWNAMQHGSDHDPKALVLIRVLISSTDTRPVGPQSPGGWGCFLIERAAQGPSDLARRIVELCVYREGGGDELESRAGHTGAICL